MPMPLRSFAVAAAAAFVLGPAGAQPPSSCSEIPFFDYDAVAENFLGISPGFVGEYCQHLDLTSLLSGAAGALCTNAGTYWVIATLHGITRDGGTPQAVLGDVRVRRALAIANDLDNPLNGTTERGLGVPPSFPSYFLQPVPPFDDDFANALLEEAGWVLNDEGIHVCRGWNGDDSTQALPSDVGPGPVNEIHASFDGGSTWELVQGFPGYEQVRSVDMGVAIAPIGGSLTGSQVVPPNASTARGAVGAWEYLSGSWQFWGNHELPNPTTIKFYYSAFGEDGPEIADLGDPSSPFDKIYTPPDPGQFAADLAAGSIALVVGNDGGESIRTNLALAERRIEQGPFTYSVRAGLSHPGTANCYDAQYVGGGDATLQFDFVEEHPVTFANGTVPGFDEIETPRGGPFFSFQTGVAVDSGPAELFPSGFFEPGTGTPLTDGCMDIGEVEALDFSSYAVVRRATLEAFAGSSAVFPPQDVTNFFQSFRQAGSWRSDARLDLPGAAGLGIDRVILRVDAVDGIFGDPFKTADTDAWDVTVNPP
jgi:hypothetical protein